MLDNIVHPYNKELSEIGYTVFDSLEENIVTELYDFYQSIQSPQLSGFHPSMFWEDVNLKKKISNKISTALENWVKVNFPDYRILYGNFMVKEPGENSIMKIHQDWSYVEETQYQSFAIWFPLSDLTQKNGALSMIPNSHLFDNHDRGPGVHCPFYENEDYLIQNFGKNLYLKKGQPVVWEHHLLHFSPPNLSENTRIAVTAIIVPKDIPVYHYYKNEEKDLLEQFEIEPDFYFNYEIGKRPEKFAKLSQQKKISTITFTKESLMKTLEDKQDNIQMNWLEKIKNIFS
ncbi:MAG TPA: phytanoyl-CoA dioxygenase family protein [Chitinophagales bacterium]|nr:phytanoyl-CoA dioxygenase family protein [Chitinophagales bacterium]